MQIKLQGTAIPCWAEENITTGLAVKLVPNTFSKINPDVVIGAVLPDADDDTGARYIAAFPVQNAKPPLYVGLPTLDETGNTTTQPYSLRGFVEGSENLPADVTLRMVDPRLKEEETIPSGTLMLAYDEGIYEVTSGCIFGTTFAVGDPISIKAGGQVYNASGGQVAVVMEYKATSNKLTIKTGNIT
jgi:hypothetical protein